MKKFFIFISLIMTIVYLEGITLDSIVPLTVCTTPAKSTDDLNKAYTQYSNALLLLETQQTYTPDIAQKITMARAQVTSLYNDASKVSSTSVDYSLLVAKTVYAMFLNVLQAIIDSLLTQSSQQLNSSSIEQNMETAYQQIRDNMQKNPSSASFIMQNGINGIKQLVCGFTTQVELAFNVVSFSQDQQKRNDNAQKLLQQRIAYFNAFQTFIKAAEPLYVQLLNLFSTSQKILNAMQGKKYDQAAVITLSGNYTTLLQSYVQAYKKANLGIHQQDPTNLIVVALRNLAFFYLQSMGIQLQWFTFSPGKDYQFLDDLAVRIIGTQSTSDPQLVQLGYDGFLLSLISSNFGTNTGDIENYYMNEKIKRIFPTYQTALNQLSTVANPSDQQLHYAEHFFSIVDSLVSQLPATVQSTIFYSNNLNVATVYAARGITILSREMNPNNQQNEVLLNQVIAYYTNAVAHYTKAANTQLVTMYQNFVSSLTQARIDRNDAQTKAQAGDIDQAKILFAKAHDEFVIGGDIVDATLMTGQIATVAYGYALDQAKKTLQSFISSYKTSFQAYMTYISAPDAKNPGQDFNAMFSALVSMSSTMMTQYQEAITQFQTLLSSNPAMTGAASMSNQVAQLQQAVDVLSSLIQAQGLMSNGTLAAQLRTASDLNRAENIFSQAVTLFAHIDTVLARNDAVAQLVLPLSLISTDPSTTWNYQTLAQRAIARLYIDQASQATSDVALLYYTYAKNRNAWLSTAMNSFLDNQLSLVQKNQQAIDQVFKQASDNETKALALPASAWQILDTTKMYDSQAVQLWQETLRGYWSAYQLGKVDALDSFIKAVNEYAAAYKQNVDPRYYPALGQALILYNAYVVYAVGNDKQKSDAVLAGIEQSVNDFFGQVTDLMTQVNNTALMTTATGNQQKVIEWLQFFDNALDQQQTILSQRAPSTSDQSSLLLFTKTVDSLANVVCTLVPTSKSVTIPNPILTFAQVYEKVGTYYFNQKNYYPAWTSYDQAVNYYNQAQLTISTTLSNNRALAHTRAIADEYYQFVLPQEMVKINGLTVPKDYLLKLYQQTVPSEILGLFNFSAIPANQVTQFSVNIASLLYLFNKINDFFGTGQFLTYYSIIQNQQESTLSSDVQTILATIVQDWKSFTDDLNARVTSKKTSVVLIPSATTGTPSFSLAQYNVPLPIFINFPAYPGPYKYYPYVLQYYNAAQMLYASSPTSISLQYSLVPGNDPVSYQKATQAIINAYVGEGYQFQLQVDTINTSADMQKVKTTAPTDMTVDVKIFQPLYSTIDDSYTKMIAFYALPVQPEQGLLSAQDPVAQSLTKVIANSYKAQADNLALFLLGSPTNPNGKYQQWLNQISAYYSAAILSYGYAADLWKTVAHLYENAGDTIVNQKNFFGAAPFFAAAQEFYKKFYQQTTSPDIIRVKLKECAAYFYGATYNMGTYQQDKTQSQTITLCSGTSQTLSFQEILSNYDAWRMQAVGTDPAIVDRATLFKSTILDALIYYGAVSNMVSGFALNVDQNIGQAAQNFADAQQAGDASGSTTQSPAQKGAQDLITTLFQQNNIKIDTLPDIITMMTRSDFPDFIIKIFDQLKQTIQGTTDASTTATNYLTMSLLAERLYSAFSQVYINDFLPGLDQVTAQNTLMQDMQNEAQTIEAPPQQFLGDTSC